MEGVIFALPNKRGHYGVRTTKGEQIAARPTVLEPAINQDNRELVTWQDIKNLINNENERTKETHHVAD